MSTQQQQEMKTISWVSKNAHLINFSIDKSNEPDTEPESDTDEEVEEKLECNCRETGEIDEETGFKVMDCDLCGEGLIGEEEEETNYDAEQQKPNLTTEMFAEFLRQHLTKEQQEEYNEMMKRYNMTIPIDVRLELKGLNLTPDELYNFTNEEKEEE